MASFRKVLGKAIISNYYYNKSSYVLNGKYTIKTGFDDTFSGSGAGLNFQGGQYKKIADKTVDKICATLYNETFREYYENFQASQKNPVPWNTCPYPTGPNEINDYYVEDYGSMLPAYVPGSEKWKLEVRILKEKAILGGYNLYFILRSERSLLGN